MVDTARIEQTEIAAWRDMIDAAPEVFRKENGLRYRHIGGGLAINFQKMPIQLFNRVIGSGITEPITGAMVGEIKEFYTHGEKYLIHYSSPMLPADADQVIMQNGFRISGSWERVVRGNEPLDVAGNSDIRVKLVDKELRSGWARFLCDTYGFSFYEWPLAFSGRKGWKHYVALRDNRIIACRSFFTTGMGTVFSGVDGPVPGVMTADCVPDFAIWHQAISDHLGAGAQLFVADIELADKETNSAAYEGFRQLGFHIPYTRYHYRLSQGGNRR